MDYQRNRLNNLPNTCLLLQPRLSVAARKNTMNLFRLKHYRYTYLKKKKTLFCPSVNIFYFPIFLKIIIVAEKIIIQLGFNNSEEGNQKKNIWKWIFKKFISEDIHFHHFVFKGVVVMIIMLMSYDGCHSRKILRNFPFYLKLEIAERSEWEYFSTYIHT